MTQFNETTESPRRLQVHKKCAREHVSGTNGGGVLVTNTVIIRLVRHLHRNNSASRGLVVSGGL